MKTMIGATFAIALTAFAAPALAVSTSKTATPAAPKATAAETTPASLDERLGCGVLLVTIDEVLRRNPELAAKFSGGDKSSSMTPMFRLLGASGGVMLDEAYAEGATQGLTPTALYRRGVADLSTKFAQSGKDQAMAVLGRCMQVATPES
ncbi:hypothetical protein [Caulobacter soli]|uniref:hypothetical protein n=1 Tax=Caulobacter soli TaxID=2708539 RepID=UPI0013EDABB6|nr:hypothetical protein [Caulobacter soli]